MVLLATDPRPAASSRCSRSGTAHRSASGSARDGSGRRSARFRSRPELRSAWSPLRSARLRGRRRPSPTQICRAPLQGVGRHQRTRIRERRRKTGECRRRCRCDICPSLFQNSVSPGDRDKYRSRSPPDVEPDVKRRKEDKLGHVSNIFFFRHHQSVEFKNCEKFVDKKEAAL